MSKVQHNLKCILFIISLCLLTVLSGCAGKQHHSTPTAKPQGQNPKASDHRVDQENRSNSNPIYVCEDISRFVDKQVGSGECVDLLKACANTPHTYQWQKGKTVWGNSIPTGTAIATFKQSKYPNKSGYHAAIYVSQNEKGLYVWDQWHGKNVHLRLIRFNNSKKEPGNDATRYSVITQ